MKRVVIFLVIFYRKYLSPMMLPRCRFYPTCSSYALEAIEEKGLFKGMVLAGFRILRCNPFSSGGYDPVKHDRVLTK